MISASSSKGLSIVAWVLQVLTGCLFLLSGACNLLGVDEMINFLDQVGFGQWLRYVLEVLEAGSGAALFLPRLAFYGAVVLFVSLVGHIFIHAAVLHCPAAFLVLLLAVTVLIALLRRPSANAREGRSVPRRKAGAFCLRLG